VPGTSNFQFFYTSHRDIDELADLGVDRLAASSHPEGRDDAQRIAASPGRRGFGSGTFLWKRLSGFHDPGDDKVICALRLDGATLSEV